MNDGGLVNLIAGFYRLVLPVGFTGWFYWLVLLVGFTGWQSFAL